MKKLQHVLKSYWASLKSRLAKKKKKKKDEDPYIYPLY